MLELGGGGGWLRELTRGGRQGWAREGELPVGGRWTDVSGWGGGWSGVRLLRGGVTVGVKLPRLRITLDTMK